MATVVKVMLVFTEKKDYLFRDQNREGTVKCEDVRARRVVPIGYGTHGSVLYRIRTVSVEPDSPSYWSGYPELVTAMVNTGSCQVNNINVGCHSLSHKSVSYPINSLVVVFV